MATKTRLAVVLALLVNVSVFSWWLSARPGQMTLAPNFAIAAVVLFIALLKVRVIMREFMEIGIAPAWVRRSSDSWLAIVFAALFVVYYSLQS